MSRRGMTAVAAVAFLAGAGAASLIWMSRPAAEAGSSPAAAALYYCPMHPSVTSDRPGDCPICQMRMVPMQGGANPPAAAPGASQRVEPIVQGRAPVHLSEGKLRLIGARTEPASRRPLVRTVRAVGRVTYDETRLHHVHTKVGGWVERLHANATGELVRQGEPLLTIYSPELLASAQEYLLALRARDRLAGTTLSSIQGSGDDLVASARRRLELFDLTAQQIAALESTGEAPRTMTLHAPATGHVIDRNVTQGERIEPGTNLLDIADLRRVWVLADVYEYELPLVKPGQPARMTLSYLPGRVFAGRVSLVYPVVSQETRTVKVRLEFANPGLLLKPEMFAEVELSADLGLRLVVPESAVLGTGRRDIVFVEEGPGHFAPRELTLGARVDSGFEVLSGLAEGERVLVSGNFLIDSESRLKAALESAGSASEPAAAPPASGHSH